MNFDVDIASTFHNSRRLLRSPPKGTTLTAALCPSIRLFRVSDFLEIGKPQKLLIAWKHSDEQQ